MSPGGVFASPLACGSGCQPPVDPGCEVILIKEPSADFSTLGSAKNSTVSNILLY
jgi:hypothetical protein